MSHPVAALPDPVHGFSGAGRFSAWSLQWPRLVMVDVEGTLLSMGEEASPEVCRSVTACHAAGLEVGLATGRSLDGCSGLIDRLSLAGPHVLFNGAQVVIDERVKTWPLVSEWIVALCDLVEESGTYLEVYTPDGFWVSDDREAIMPHWDTMQHRPLGHVRSGDPDKAFKGDARRLPRRRRESDRRNLGSSAAHG